MKPGTWCRTIETRFLPATNRHGSRVVARVGHDARNEPGRVLNLSWSHELDARENHERCALALATMLGWVPSAPSEYAVGETRTAHVFLFPVE